LSLRYSIYKVQCSLFRCRSQLFHSSTFKLICQELFQVFSNLFEVFRFACCSLSNFAMLAHPIGIVKNFFHILSNFFRICHSIAPPAGDSHILAHASAFVKQNFYNFRIKKGASYEAPFASLLLNPHRQSDRSRLRFSCRQPRRIRRCLHHGRRRSYVPADSSA